MTHSERAPLEESNVTIVAGKAVLKKCASRKNSISHQKARAQSYPTSARRPNRLESSSTRMQAVVLLRMVAPGAKFRGVTLQNV